MQKLWNCNNILIHVVDTFEVMFHITAFFIQILFWVIINLFYFVFIFSGRAVPVFLLKKLKIPTSNFKYRCPPGLTRLIDKRGLDAVFSLVLVDAVNRSTATLIDDRLRTAINHHIDIKISLFSLLSLSTKICSCSCHNLLRLSRI